MNDFGGIMMLSQAIQGLQILLNLYAVFVVVKYRRCSRWMNLILAGLIGMIVVPLLYFVIPYTGMIQAGAGAVVVLLPSFLGVAVWGVFIVGLAGMLKDVHARLSPAKDSFDDFP